MKSKYKTVFVGVSGGVDSSVSAALLKEQGYNVVGVFIRTWTPDFIECTWRDERRDAMRVCAHLGIPFLECDAEKEYKEGVADYMIEEYKKGKTPNPDVMCNREVKFGVFWNFAKSHGADFIATGHYAVNTPARLTGAVHLLDSLNTKKSQKVLRKLHVFAFSPTPVASQGLLALRKSKDDSKDQSYFLWTLTQEDLRHTLFPVGHLNKTEVRKLAEKYKLPTATKKDSQGVCFLGQLDMKDFLKHYIKSEKGNVLDEKGEIIGTHDGAVFFTLGERHGFRVNKKEDNEKPLYVISKNIKDNTITVSLEPGSGGNKESNYLEIEKVNWISSIPEKDKKYTAQIRYHGEHFSCKVEVSEDKKAKIIFDKNILVDSGQSIVVYDVNACLGGGIVG
ncbi:MAG TPA: tRNA 2-thiouridine(34) synthase MnmA [Candidatus Paceibacterota bacterium]|nr:tRNA 2-thiouridine(34) synthase MnmA [Candidatus Paceibacterota bacterium]